MHWPLAHTNSFELSHCRSVVTVVTVLVVSVTVVAVFVDVVQKSSSV